MSKKKIDLVLIDPQNDFSDPKGSLFVPGANEDMNRMADFIDRMRHKLNDIHVSLDSHHTICISSTHFWQNSNGDKPTPFTMITSADVESGKWITKIPSHQKRAISYLKALENTNRYSLILWPDHCLIGSWGGQIYTPVFDALKKWEEEEFGVIDMVSKGSNVWTEHYSAVKAEVPDPQDPSTQINTNFIQTLEQVDEIVITGEALSHCLRHTFKDIVDNFSEPSFIKKMVLLTDCSSSVSGFEKEGQDFIKEMTARGMRTSTSDKYLR